MYDIIIVGAGPAGLTAALYAGRARKKILVLEAKSYGGQIIKTNKIENYPGIPIISGFEFATNLYNQVKDLGIDIIYEPVIRIDDDLKVITTNGEYYGKSIILATGAENKKINIENESKLVGNGISYCATCDGNFFRGKEVAVYGEDTHALEDALYLSNIAKKVYFIARNDSYHNSALYNDILKCDNIEIIESVIEKINGDTFLESIVISHRELKVDGLFISVGTAPKNEIFKNFIELDDAGYILSQDGVHTTHPKVYVAGDTRVKELRQLTTAVADGAIAATTAIKEMED